MCTFVCPVCHKLHEVHNLKLSLNMRLYKVYRANGTTVNAPLSHVASHD